MDHDSDSGCPYSVRDVQSEGGIESLGLAEAAEDQAGGDLLVFDHFEHS
jgi:hypothetical protein